MKHDLKIWPQYYARVADGSKTFEIRHNDRGFQPGDTVVLKEWDPTPKNPSDKSIPVGYTGSPELSYTVGYVHILDADTVVFSLLPIKKPVKKTKKARKTAKKTGS